LFFTGVKSDNSFNGSAVKYNQYVLTDPTLSASVTFLFR